MRVLLALLFVGGIARADAPTPWSEGVPQEAQDKAQALFAEGNDLYKEEKHAPAVEKYRAALALWDHPVIRLNLAAALIDLDRFLEAADEIDHALRYGGTPFSKDDYKKALDYQKLLAGRVGDIEVTCKQTGVHVLFDGKPWFDCPATKRQRVLVGPHAVVGQREAFLTSSQRVFAVSGEPAKLDLELVSLDAAVKLEYPRPRWMPWTIAGVGSAVALTGLAVWLAGRSEMDRFRRELTAQCPEGCDLSGDMYRALRDERDAGQLKGDIGIALEITGGIAAVTGVVLAVTNRPRRVLPHVEVAPTAGGATAHAAWRF